MIGRALAFCKLYRPVYSQLAAALLQACTPDIMAHVTCRSSAADCLNSNVFTDLAMRLGRPWLSRLEDACPRLGRRASWGLLSCACIATR